MSEKSESWWIIYRFSRLYRKQKINMKSIKGMLNHAGIKKIFNTESFINKYNWEGINFPLEKDD